MGVVLGVCGTMVAAACADVPTAAERPDGAAPARSAGGSGNGGTIEVVCMTSQATSGGSYAYEYGRLDLKLPASTRAADGSTRLVRYRFYVGQQVVRAADCTIPNSTKALEKINHLFRVTLPEQTKAKAGWTAQPMSTGDEPVILDPLEPKACQYGDPAAYPDCAQPGVLPEDQPVDNQVCSWWNTCGGYTSGGGGDSSLPPCNTGNVVVDSKAVGTGFDQLWKASNADANLANRKEQGGWVVQTSTGIRIEQWPDAGNFCAINATVQWPPEGPGSIIGFVHTHPYSVGETIPVCDPQSGNVVGFGPYLGTPSTPDRSMSSELGQQLGRPGGLQGYILDKNGIRTYEGYNSSRNVDYGRCAF